MGSSFFGEGIVGDLAVGEGFLNRVDLVFGDRCVADFEISQVSESGERREVADLGEQEIEAPQVSKSGERCDVGNSSVVNTEPIQALQVGEWCEIVDLSVVEVKYA